MPRFRPGEEVILFLQNTARGDYLGGELGSRNVSHSARCAQRREIVVQDTASYETYDPMTRRIDAEGIRNLSVAGLRLRVRSALDAQSGAEK